VTLAARAQILAEELGRPREALPLVREALAIAWKLPSEGLTQSIRVLLDSVYADATADDVDA
jgi:uncharacterized protein YbjT (DUF2867 family)